MDPAAAPTSVMVATDITRGIDVASISHVINYDIPDTADAYIHRIRRTGRAEREGRCLYADHARRRCCHRPHD
ncbi:MAG: helicase-related protein [Kouleothrix sp.]